MYKHHLCLIAFVGLASLALSYVFGLQYSTDLSGQIITVIAILFGFYVTSATLILSGDAITFLHDTIDERGDRRLTHTLRDYYSFGLSCLLIGLIIYILISIFFSSENSEITDFDLAFTWNKVVSSIGTSMLATNIAFAFIQTRLFLVMFIKEPYAKAEKVK